MILDRGRLPAGQKSQYVFISSVKIIIILNTPNQIMLLTLCLFQHLFSIQPMSSREQLRIKKQKSESFKKQMEKAEVNYHILSQRAYYSGFSGADCTFITQFNGKSRLESNIYFIDGQQQQFKAKSLDKLSLCLITKIPKPKSNYLIVYFNNTDYSNSFSDLKTVFQILPFQYFYFLTRIVLVKPTFLEKAGRIFVFGTVPKFINSQIENVDSVKQLCQLLVLDKQEIMKYAPIGYETPLKKQPSKQRQEHNHLRKYDDPHKQKNKNHQIHQNKAVKETVQKFQINEYDKAQNGLPQIFQILIYYFQEHPEGLQLQGIFRKSANIQEEAEAIQKMSRKHYKCLQQIDNPHIVANLIKKFLGNLKTPIIPFDMFDQLMNEPQISLFFLNSKMKLLGSLNLTKLITLMFLFQFLLTSVVPHVKTNKMTCQNLAICFAPCLMWAKQRSIKDIAYATKSVQVATLMLKNFQDVFGTKQDQQKLYRESYYNHKTKSLQKVLSLSEDNKQILNSLTKQQINLVSQENDKANEEKQLILQKTVSDIEILADEVDEVEEVISKRVVNTSKVQKKGIFGSRLQSVSSLNKSLKQNKIQQKGGSEQ